MRVRLKHALWCSTVTPPTPFLLSTPKFDAAEVCLMIKGNPRNLHCKQSAVDSIGEAVVLYVDKIEFLARGDVVKMTGTCK